MEPVLVVSVSVLLDLVDPLAVNKLTVLEPFCHLEYLDPRTTFAVFVVEMVQAALDVMVFPLERPSMSVVFAVEMDRLVSILAQLSLIVENVLIQMDYVLGVVLPMHVIKLHILDVLED